MQVSAIQNYRYKTLNLPISNRVFSPLAEQKSQEVSFTGLNPIKEAKGFIAYLRAQKYADGLYSYVKNQVGEKKFIFREYNLEPLEGIQHGIKVFKDLTIKEIQYLSENLHVIAVKRGCNHMCGYCYADAKPSNRQMSYEDFHLITSGFKTLRERMHGLDLFGEALPINRDIEKSTELFYDADCMNIVLKDKKGKEYDFPTLASELYESLGRKTVFDTSGWDVNNAKLQQRAYEYAKHFADPENMKKLTAFNISFNVFNASYIASRKALKAGDVERAAKLKNKFTTNMANTLFTFSPVAEHANFNIMMRSFRAAMAKRSQGFAEKDMSLLRDNVLNKLEKMYIEDLNGEQRYIKSEADLKKYIRIFKQKMLNIDTALNSSGRMKQFVEEFGIKPMDFQDHSKTTPILIEHLKDSARNSRFCMLKLIDADGKVYHMDYARFFPTEIQLNISGKNSPTPSLANLIKQFTVTRENLKK